MDLVINLIRRFSKMLEFIEIYSIAVLSHPKNRNRYFVKRIVSIIVDHVCLKKRRTKYFENGEVALTL